MHMNPGIFCINDIIFIQSMQFLIQFILAYNIPTKFMTEILNKT